MEERSILGQNPTRTKQSKVFTIGLLTSVIIIISSVTLLLFIKSQKNNPYKEQFSSVQKTQDFPILYPKKISNDFQLQGESIKSSGGIVTSFYRSGNNTIVVTQQKKPTDFNSDILSGSKDIEISYGKGYVAELGDKSRGIIITDHTLLSVSGTGAIDEATLTKFIENF